MRRSLLLGLLGVGAIGVMLCIVLAPAFDLRPAAELAQTRTQGASPAHVQTTDRPADPTEAAPSRTHTPSPTPTQSLSTHQADLTHWAATATPTDFTAADNARWEAVRATAAAYGTAHAGATGDLEVGFDLGGLRPRVRLSEAEVNALIRPYAAELGDVRNVSLDLVPGGGVLTADLVVLGLTVGVHASAELVVVDGLIQTHVTEASIGGLSPPEAALQAVNEDLVPMVNSALNDALAQYAPPSHIYLTAITVTDADLTVTFVLRDP